MVVEWVKGEEDPAFDPTGAQYWRTLFEEQVKQRNEDVLLAHESAGENQREILLLRASLREAEAELERLKRRVGRLKRELATARTEVFAAETAKEARQLLRRAMRLIAYDKPPRR